MREVTQNFGTKKDLSKKKFCGCLRNGLSDFDK